MTTVLESRKSLPDCIDLIILPPLRSHVRQNPVGDGAIECASSIFLCKGFSFVDRTRLMSTIPTKRVEKKIQSTAGAPTHAASTLLPNAH